MCEFEFFFVREEKLKLFSNNSFPQNSMRKVKFTQQTISERLTTMLTDFPRLNDIHPFYADLCNTLYDRDHYKLALGQLNTARSLVDQIARDMIRMIKYADSAYRCKCLKRAALGRMCTVLKRQKASLAYLEEVRKHLSRLPALDPNTRTLLMCGLPNVGKSSFMNKITRGNVDVQPYAFTTKSLFVGHCDYKYLRWQVIDTPGILDHSLEERNTIEMQAIIALAHLTCAVLYFCDPSEQCGYTIEQQCSLFRSIKPLFANKQLIIVVNKVDQQPWDTLESDKKEMIEALAKDANCSLMTMSNVSEHGVSDVKNTACEKLLSARVDARVSNKKIEGVMNRLQVFHPTPRDSVSREANIPDSVKQALEDGKRIGTADHKPKRSRIGYAQTVDDEGAGINTNDGDDAAMMDTEYRKTARDLMWENGGPGVWAPDYREQYDLKDEEWRFDAIPEIMDGKNIADYVDPDIEQRLAELEEEEDQIVKELEAQKMGQEPESDLDSEEEAAVEAIRDRKKIARKMSQVNKSENKPVVPRTIRGRTKDMHQPGDRTEKVIKEKMSKLGVDASRLIERGRSLEQERGRKRERSRDVRSRRSKNGIDDDNADDDGFKDEEMHDADSTADGRGLSKTQAKKQKRSKSEAAKREASITRYHGRPRDPSQDGLHSEAAIATAKKLVRQGRKSWAGGAGEGDNRKAVHLVKWMNTGKKRNGTHYCR